MQAVLVLSTTYWIVLEEEMVPGAGLEPARGLPLEGFSYQLQLLPLIR
nr:hypothetical protein [uncultured bacterium]